MNYLASSGRGINQKRLKLPLISKTKEAGGKVPANNFDATP